MKVLRIIISTNYAIIISLLKCVNSLTFLQWKSTTPLLQLSVSIKGSRPGFSPLHLAMITGCIAVVPLFPPLYRLISVCTQTPIGHYSFYFKRGIKAVSYKYQMWPSQLSSDVMWLHKPPTVSLLPLDTPGPLFMMVNKQNTCWGGKVRERRKKRALINWSFGFIKYVFEVWLRKYLTAQLETLCAADITADHRAGCDVGVWLLWGSTAIMETRNLIHQWKK